MKLKQYSKYKDSGIEWIGEIPEDWEIHKLKNIAEIETGQTPPKDNAKYYVNGFFPWVKPDELNGFNPIMTSKTKLSNEGKLISRIIPKNSILVCCIGSLGKIGIAGVELATNQQINSVIPSKDILDYNFAKFLIYASKEEYEKIGNANVVAIVNKNQQGNILYPIPKINQQTKINNFLDKKIEDIDSLIAKNKKLIQLLEEKRTSLINHVVTKGLDPNVKMKYSGIEWIGEIPEDWSVNKIKNTSYVKGRIGWHGLSSDEYSDEGPYLVTGTNFEKGEINWESCHHISLERYKQDPYIHLQNNDLLITKDGTIGKVALVRNLPDNSTLNSGIFLIRPLDGLYLSEYLYYILKSDIFKIFFDFTKTGATIVHLYQETFERFFFPIPSFDVQKKIVSYLNEKINKLNTITDKCYKNLDLLNESKKSLIYHVVTGKLSVG